MDLELYDKLAELIDKTVRRVVWDFSTVDREDLTQSMWELVLEKGVSPDQPGLRSFLYRKAKDMAWAERKDQLKLSAQYSYRTEDVKLILETFFEDITCWVSSFAPNDAKDSEVDGMAGLEVHIDVSLAFKKLPWDQQDAIILRYRDQVIPERGTPEQRRLSRAVKTLAEIMNFYG